MGNTGREASETNKTSELDLDLPLNYLHPSKVMAKRCLAGRPSRKEL
jgi:hypothetical protein